MELTKYKLGKLIEQCDNRNTDEEYTADDVRGISTGKEFIETKANMDGVSLTSYKIVKENEFAYVADTSRRGDKIAVAFNRNEGNILISSIYSYLELWEEILNQGIHIELSRSSMYILRRCITGFSFEQGIRMRKIIEKISLQR